MNATEAMQPIIALREDVLKLPHEDYGSLDKYKRRAKLLITKAFGRQSDYLNELDALEFEAAGYYDPQAWDLGKVSFANLLSTVLEDMKLPNFTRAEAVPKELSNRVFVVHGHDNEMKLAVARALEKLGLQPIILHEQPDMGKTIIEKFVH